MKKYSIKNSTIIVTLLSLISAFLGFGRESFIAYKFGASELTDAFYVASILPDIIAGWLGYSLTNALIPVLKKELIESKSSAQLLINTVLNITFIGLSLLCLGTYLSLDHIIGIMAPDFNDVQLEQTLALLKIMLISIIFSGLSGVLWGVHNAKEVFIFPAFIGVVYNTVFLAILLVFSNWLGYKSLAYAFLVGMFGKFIFQFIPLFKEKDFSYQLILWHRKIPILFKAMIPILVTVVLGNVNQIVERALASTLPTGHITNLNFAAKLGLLPFPLIGGAISMVLYPKFVNDTLTNDKESLKQTVITGLSWMLFIGIIIGTGFLLFSETLISLLFYNGAFTRQDVYISSSPLMIFGIFSTSFLFIPILLRFFYSRNEGKFITIASIISVTINIIGSFILVSSYGINGLVFANCIAQSILVFILLRTLTQRLDTKFFKTLYMILYNAGPSGISFLIGVLLIFFAWESPGIDQKFTLLLRGIIAFISGSITLIIYSYTFKSNLISKTVINLFAKVTSILKISRR